MNIIKWDLNVTKIIYNQLYQQTVQMTECLKIGPSWQAGNIHEVAWLVQHLFYSSIHNIEHCALLTGSYDTVAQMEDWRLQDIDIIPHTLIVYQTHKQNNQTSKPDVI
jgi:hypothetical protein